MGKNVRPTGDEVFDLEPIRPPDARRQQEFALYRRAAKIERYKRDFRSFCGEQLWIRPKLGPICRLDLWPHQVLIEEKINNQLKTKGWIRLVEFKCRQEGGSTHGVARTCHRTFLNENVSSLIIANDDAATENLFNMAGLYYDGMEKEIRPVRRYLTKQEIVLENPDVKTRADFPGLRSRINIQSAKNVHSGVGTTRNFVELSEFCRFGNVRDLMGSLIPAIPTQPGTGIIVESAPFGYGEGRDHFRAWCDRARSGKDQYAFVAIYWWMCPGYELPLDSGDVVGGRFRTTLEERRLIKLVEDVSRRELGREITLSNERLKFRRIQIEALGRGDTSMGEALFQQQYPSDYASGWITFDLLVFDQWKVQELKKRYEAGPLRRCVIVGDDVVDTTTNAPFWIWEEPIPGELYDIGADTATEGGPCACAFHVIKRSNNEQVAEYNDPNTGPLDFAKVLYSVGLWYNAAHIGVEVDGIGYATNEALNQMGYPNIYIWRKRDHIAGAVMGQLTGWKTQFDSKRLLIAVSQHMLTHDEVIVHSSRLFAQMTRFIQLLSDSGNEQYVAQEGNSDLVMSWMITLVIARDEKGLENPMQRGAQLDREPTLAERNERMRKGIAEGPAYIDNLEREMAVARRDDDPWSRFEKAMKGGDLDG